MSEYTFNTKTPAGKRYHLIVVTIIYLQIFLSAIVLSGWLLNITILQSIFTGFATMKVNTAICFMFAALALHYYLKNKQRHALIFTFVVAAISGLTLLQYSFGLSFGIDELLIKDSLTPPEMFPGRIALATSISFLFIAGSLVLYNSRLTWKIASAQIAGAFVMLFAFIALVGYLYDVKSLYHFSPYSSVALHTAIILFLFSAALIFTHWDEGLIAVATSSKNSGVTARRLILPAFLLPLITGWLCSLAVEGNLLSYQMAFAIFAILNLFLLSNLILLNSFLLKETEDELHKILNAVEQADDMICITNIKGIIEYVNPALLRVTGYLSSELIGKTPSILKSNLTDKEYGKKLWAAISEGKIFKDNPINKKKNGEIYYSQQTITPIKNDRGEITHFVSTCKDITQQKKHEAELNKLSRAIEQSSVSIVITDSKGTIEYTNPFFTKLTGYQSYEAYGKNPRILKSGFHSKDHYDQLWKQIMNGEVWRGEMFNRKKTGEHYWAMEIISPVFDSEKKISHFIAIEEDITEKKNLIEELIIARDKAEEMNKVKSFFFANISHELRTPLIGVLGFSEMMRDTVEDEELRTMADVIFNGGTRLLNTLNQILNLSKLESNTFEMKPKLCDVIEIVKRVYESLSKEASKIGIDYRLNTDEEKIFSKIDESFFTTIITSLINNALKFTSEGKVIVSVSKNSSNVVIKIEDTGIGIPIDKQEIIWGEFRQASEGLSRSFEGTGLGLTITKRYVDAMGGSIHLESEEDKGSTFTVEFPLALDNIDEMRKRIEDEKSSVTNMDISSQKNILFLDDDPIARDVVSKILSPLYNIEHVLTAEKAFEKVNHKKYDAILMDINLRRGMDGIMVTQEIRKMENYKNTPIVAITAFAMDEERSEFLSKGMTHYISKPFTKKQLLDFMEEVFKVS